MEISERFTFCQNPQCMSEKRHKCGMCWRHCKCPWPKLPEDDTTVSKRKGDKTMTKTIRDREQAQEHIDMLYEWALNTNNKELSQLVENVSDFLDQDAKSPPSDSGGALPHQTEEIV